MHFSNRRLIRAAAPLAAPLTLATLLVGCSSDSSSSPGTEATSTPGTSAEVAAPGDSAAVGSPGAAAPTATRTPASDESAPTTSSNGVTVTGAAGGQPRIEVTRDEPAPTELVIVDIYPGDGTELETGGSGVFEYEGVLFGDGSTFDSSWDRGSPVSLSLERVIPGWQEGLVGMQVGGRRMIIVPPDAAYGDRALPGIPPNSTLVFVVDLVEVTG